MAEGSIPQEQFAKLSRHLMEHEVLRQKREQQLPKRKKWVQIRTEALPLIENHLAKTAREQRSQQELQQQATIRRKLKSILKNDHET